MTWTFIDTHCHFDFPPFAGHVAESLARAAQAGVTQIIVPAIEAENFPRVLALAEQHEAIYAAMVFRGSQIDPSRWPASLPRYVNCGRNLRMSLRMRC